MADAVERERRLRAEVFVLARIAEARDESFETPSDDSALHEIEGALSACVHVGLFSAAEARWLRELADHMDQAPPELSAEDRVRVARLLDRLPSGGETLTFHDAVAAAASLGALETPAEDEPEEPEPLVGLKAVLPGPLVAGGVRIISVECYEGGLLLRWETTQDLPPGLRDAGDEEVYEQFRRAEASWDEPVVTDDVGTGYRPEGGGGSSSLESGRWRSSWRSSYVPGVPATARTLTVELGDERFDFDAVGVAERSAV